MEEFDVSVVLNTYNRAKMLGPALESLAHQNAAGVRFEVLVIDNNSTDNTRAVVDEFRNTRPNWSYVFEPQQGVAYARNAGAARARAPIVAFTDDDVRVAPDWVAQVKRSFDEHPHADMLGGKVVPLWKSSPPAWLSELHWAPLALLDDGDEPFYVSAEKPAVLLGLCARGQAFMEANGFDPRFQRVKDSIGSTEDHEFQLRMLQSGKLGLYAPSVIIYAEVQEDRLRKSYHRRWHSGHGRYSAMMGTDPFPEDAPEIFGVPAFYLRQLIGHGVGWLKAVCTGREGLALAHENKVRFGVNYIRTYHKLRRPDKQTGMTLGTWHGMRQLLRRKLLPDRTR